MDNDYAIILFLLEYEIMALLFILRQINRVTNRHINYNLNKLIQTPMF